MYNTNNTSLIGSNIISQYLKNYRSKKLSGVDKILFRGGSSLVTKKEAPVKFIKDPRKPLRVLISQNVINQLKKFLKGKNFHIGTVLVINRKVDPEVDYRYQDFPDLQSSFERFTENKEKLYLESVSIVEVEGDYVTNFVEGYSGEDLRKIF